MEFKCKILQITLRQHTGQFNYRMNNTILKMTDQSWCMPTSQTHRTHVLCNPASRLTTYWVSYIETSRIHKCILNKWHISSSSYQYYNLVLGTHTRTHARTHTHTHTHTHTQTHTHTHKHTHTHTHTQTDIYG